MVGVGEEQVSRGKVVKVRDVLTVIKFVFSSAVQQEASPALWEKKISCDS